MVLELLLISLVLEITLKKEFIEIFNPLLGEFVFTYEDSIYITDNQYFWFDTIGTGHSEYKTPLGYISDYNSPDSVSISLISSDSYLAFGDIDQLPY